MKSSQLLGYHRPVHCVSEPPRFFAEKRGRISASMWHPLVQYDRHTMTHEIPAQVQSSLGVTSLNRLQDKSCELADS